MFSDENDLLFASDNEELRRIYLNQNDDSNPSLEFIENNENFRQIKSTIALAALEDDSKLRTRSANDTSLDCFIGSHLPLASELPYDLILISPTCID